MKILYGVQATGNGHICRSREVIRNLKRHGHDVHVLFSGRVPGLVRELDIFEPYTVRRGLTFITRKGRIEYLKTAAQLNFPEFLRDIRSFDVSGFDLVITDFEPILARIAKRHGIPSIGIGHQYAFMYDIPMAKGNPLGLFILRNFAPADYMIGLHWHHFDRPILPPIVPYHFENHRRIEKKKILVYLPFEELDEIENNLREFDTHHFHIYHGSCRQLEDKGNLHFRPFSREGFLRDLCECGGVICSAGFELPSEALHLGKRLLAKPLSGQIEQESNALALGQLGLATVSDKINVKLVRDWLNGAGDSAEKPANYTDVAGYLAEWIGGRRWDDVSGLVRSAWDAIQ
jgi:uncharacterized protein (TIGR00661 family)